MNKGEFFQNKVYFKIKNSIHFINYRIQEMEDKKNRLNINLNKNKKADNNILEKLILNH